jgi:diguanylate cyclase (GGDEF)-like protein
LDTYIARTFAALSATNEAILYAKSPEELYRQVCEAAFSSSDFMATAIFLLEPETNMLRFAAGFGEDIVRLRSIDISIVADTPEGSGVCGQAFRDQKLSISNDYLNDARSQAWRQAASDAHIGAAAAVPLICSGRSVGVLLVTRREARSLNDQIVSPLERMSANVSFALDNFERDASRKIGERAMRRLNRMFGALSATNEAILRAKTAQDLYQLVCDALVHGGKSLATVILLAEPDSIWLKPVAGTGEIFGHVTRTRFSIDPDNIYGNGVCGKAFRTQKAYVNEDILNSTQGEPWQEARKKSGAVACVALPLVKAGKSVGVLLFFVSKSWAADEEVRALLARIAENVSFALDNFERADEKAKADEQKERLTRMFAALSATNEAIMRAKSRTELFYLVCEAAVQGAKFNSTTIVLAEPNSEFLRVVASHGPNASEMRSLKYAVTDSLPEGRGLTGTAFRTRQPCISNDFLADERTRPYHETARRKGVESCAALPMRNGDRVEGVLIFNSTERGTFTPELVELLQRLAENVGFALGNFDHADEKTKADAQQERLTRMYAALSATNEAIMRAETRAELFELACEAAANGGKFTSTTIGLVQAGKDFLKIVASAGPTAEVTRKVRLSVNEDRPEGRGITGLAFRSRKPCISNDYLSDPRGTAFHGTVRTDGGKAVAAFPLFSRSQAVGILLFIAAEQDAFTQGSVDLLQRLADNISFALGNFDLADEKIKAEKQKDRLTGMFEALSETNEAIMRAKTRTQLFELVCEAAILGGTFTSATIAIAEPNGEFLRIAASKGQDYHSMRNHLFPVSATHPEGGSLSGSSFRSREPCIANDFLADERTVHWHGLAREAGIRSGASFPLLQNGSGSVGVLLFLSSEQNVFTDDLLELLAKLAENVSFALDNFDRADERAKTEEQKERLTRMFAALGATNEAIMRAKSRTELFELVCEAAVVGGNFTSTAIVLEKPGAEFLENVAAAGPDRERARDVQLSTDATCPEGRGITGTAFRTRLPCISNDYLADFGSAGHFFNALQESGTRSGAALPLLKDGNAIGAVVFLSSEIGAFSPELIELLQRLAENVSFALDNFDRADQKTKAEEQKERLTRMFVALSATNEAIMRAKTRAEMFELVCAAAANGGKFTSTTIAIANPDSDFLDVVASAGPTAQTSRNVKLSINDAHPEGRGLCGTAFRSGQPSISNDYLIDQRMSAFQDRIRSDGAKSGAAFPLLSSGRAVGVMLFISVERDTFTPEFVELLQRLAENVSFALENFERADEKAKADVRIEYLASHDSLTSLPNRETFNGLLHYAIEAARRYERGVAVLFIDLDRFKVINDSLGHAAGDVLLVETGNRLRKALRSSDVVARLGGDEFVVILEETAQSDDVERIARNLLSVLSEPLQLSGHECHTTASIGIAMYPADGTDVQTLTKNADMAMYLAKEDGKNGFRFFTREIKTQSIERLTLETALRRALGRNQFALHYQPKVDMTTGQITGVEALLRWTHPELGVLPPAQFIPLAEETGLIVSIGRWVLKEACAQNMAWQRRGLRPVSMAVNLSPRQFADEHLLRDIDEALATSGMSPVLLQLEVTESMVMQNVTRAIKVLDAIQSRGIRLAIDDFGTGYSSMSLMKQFPIDTIKIDRSFVRDLPDDSEDKAIAQAIISMGKALGLTVIAEGVETVEQETFLRDHACDEMQGFLFSKPVPPEQLADLLRCAPLVISPPLQPAASGTSEEASPRPRQRSAGA